MDFDWVLVPGKKGKIRVIASAPGDPPPNPAGKLDAWIDSDGDGSPFSRAPRHQPGVWFLPATE